MSTPSPRVEALRLALSVHDAVDAAERRDVAATLALLAEGEAAFDRERPGAHLTASAIVVDAEGVRVLLVHHRKLERWLQPGGHLEPGDASAAAGAAREAREETGIAALAIEGDLLDVDVHRIPARGSAAAHDHHDLRFVVRAPAGAAALPCEVETRGARWVPWGEVGALGPDPALQRALAKARARTAPR